MPRTVHPENLMFFREIASKRIKAPKAYEIYLERLKDPENEMPKPPHHYKSENSFKNSYYNARRDSIFRVSVSEEQLRNLRQVCLGHAVNLLQGSIDTSFASEDIAADINDVNWHLIEVAEDLFNWIITGKNKDERDFFFRVEVKPKERKNAKS
jgi:hypothetical protein